MNMNYQPHQKLETELPIDVLRAKDWTAYLITIQWSARNATNPRDRTPQEIRC